MALKPIDDAHALQIQAGILGRKAGHKFEDTVTDAINCYDFPLRVPEHLEGHLFNGNPAQSLLEYIGGRLDLTHVEQATAISTGALATSEEGKKILLIDGSGISRCKSDIVLTLQANGIKHTIGISTKQCNNKRPTNAQLYFTTASGFVSLLSNNGFQISESAIIALKQFCGDPGFRPSDNPAVLKNRLIDPRRFFWEEIDPTGRLEWEELLNTHQDHVSRLLFQKAYLDDQFVPEFLLHKTKRASSFEETEVAIYTIDELIQLSRNYREFETKPYPVRKGSYKDPPGVTHLAPRFGIIQMQKGGQSQHPTQLQFNLEASYFYKL